MTSEKLVELLDMYHEILSPAQRLNEVWYSTPHRALPTFNGGVATVQGHLAWMANEAKSFVQEGRIHKAMRWLGFIQFGLWQRGFRSLEQLKNDSKPVAGEENAPNAVDLSAELEKKQKELWAVIKAAEGAGWSGVENSKILPEFIWQLGEDNKHARERLRAIYEALGFVTDHGPDLDTYVDGHCDAHAPERIRVLMRQLRRLQTGTDIESDKLTDTELRLQAEVDRLKNEVGLLKEENERLRIERQLRKHMMWGDLYGMSPASFSKCLSAEGVTAEEATRMLAAEEVNRILGRVESVEPTVVDCDYAEIEGRVLAQMSDEAVQYGCSQEDVIEVKKTTSGELVKEESERTALLAETERLIGEGYIVVAGGIKTAQGYDLNLELVSTECYQTKGLELELQSVCDTFQEKHQLRWWTTDEEPTEFTIELPEATSSEDAIALLEELLKQLCAAASGKEMKHDNTK